MNYTERISSGPILKDKDGQLTKGFHYSIFQKWETEHIDDENGEPYYTNQSDYEGWEIYPNGTFHYEVCQDTARWCGEEEGTFDSSKYEEFVCQMKECKTDWMKELSYDRDTADYTWG